MIIVGSMVTAAVLFIVFGLFVGRRECTADAHCAGCAGGAAGAGACRRRASGNGEVP